MNVGSRLRSPAKRAWVERGIVLRMSLSIAFVPTRPKMSRRRVLGLRLVLASTTASVGFGALSAAPGSSAASGSAFCALAKTEIEKLGAIAQNFTPTISAKA